MSGPPIEVAVNYLVAAIGAKRSRVRSAFSGEHLFTTGERCGRGVSRGLGAVELPIRAYARPDVSLFTLTVQVVS